MSETATPRSAQEINHTLSGNMPEDRQLLPEEQVFLNQRLEYEIRVEHLTTLRANNQSRIKYAKRTFFLTCSWILVVLLIVLLKGLELLQLSDTVMAALISTTTLNVFGFFLLVMKYLFNPKIPA